MHDLPDGGSLHERRPVHPERAGGRRGRRGVKAGVATERQLPRHVGECPADLCLVGVLDRDPQMRSGFLVGPSVRVIEPQQPRVGLGELLPAAELLKEQLLSLRCFFLDVQAGQHHGHGVAVPAVHVDGDLERGGRRRAAGAGEQHPVGALLADLDGVECAVTSGLR